MRNVTFTVYQSARSTSGRATTRPWSEWVSDLTQHDVRGDPDDIDNPHRLARSKDGQAIILGEIPDDKPRLGTNVRAVHALALDIEGLEDDRVEAAFGAIGRLEYVAYTTHRHGSKAAGGQVKMRVILPLLDSIGPSEHAAAWSGLNRLCGGVNDPTTRDVGRLHYMPSTFDASLARAWRHPGRWLSLDDLPDETSPGAGDPGAERTANAVQRKLRYMAAEDPAKPFSKALLSGSALADAGGRHDAILKLTWWVAERDRRLSESALAALFGPSLDAMAAADHDAPGIDSVVNAYDGACTKLDEGDADHAADRRKEAAKHQAGGAGEYDEAELARIAEVCGWEPDEIKDRWIIQREGAYWFLAADGRYTGPYVKDDALIKARRILARAPVRLIETTKSGYRYRPLPDVVTESGQVAEKVISDMVVQRTSYEPVTQILHEAVVPMRHHEPVFDETVDKWLRVLAGPQYEKLVDWLSCVGDLSKLLCALYLDGEPGSGKTLLPTGLARLWTQGPPADIELVISDFNDELARCPLVLADEEIPRRYRRTVTTTLRSMLSTLQRTLKRKFKPPTELRGAVRLVLAANNEFLLDSRDVASPQDLAAIAQRFLYIKVPPEAAHMLNDLPRSTRERWAEQDIAKHATWLAKNHVIETPGRRFWVEGDVSEMHRLLMTGSKWNSLVIEWLVRYCMNPNPFDSKGTGLIRRGDAELLVNDQALIDGWELYIKQKIDPETSRIGAALRAVAKTPRRRQLRHDGQRIRYRVVDVDNLLAWSDRHNIGDRDTILANLDEPGGHLTVVVPEDSGEAAPF